MKYIILIITIFSIVFGILMGDLESGIAQKAKIVCLECIGIG